MSSTISSDPKRGLGIINQCLYKGDYAWNRSKWVKHPVTSKLVRLDRPESEWKHDTQPEQWRIVSDDLWQRVRARQVHRQRDRGPNIAAGIARSKRVGGRDSRYWLGGLLKCGGCGASLIGDGRKGWGPGPAGH